MANTSKRTQRPTTTWGRSYSAAELMNANRWLQRKGNSKQKVESNKKKSAGGKGG